MTLHQATKKLISQIGRQMKTQEIDEELVNLFQISD